MRLVRARQSRAPDIARLPVLPTPSRPTCWPLPYPVEVEEASNRAPRRAAERLARCGEGR